MSLILVADYEIFKCDSLLGVLDVNTDTIYQMWDVQEITQFIEEHLNDIWIRF